MSRRRLLYGALWGFVALAFLAGLIIGAALPLWQRAAMEADMRVLQKRLAARESSATTDPVAAGQLEQRLASAETSIQDLIARNTSLTSELAAAQAKAGPAPVTPAPSQPATTVPEEPASPSGTIVDKSASPNPVSPAGALALSVKTQGDADKVYMRIASSSKSIVYDYTFTITKGAASGGVTSWQRSIKAPPKAGTYRCYAQVGTSSGRKTAPAFTLTVK
jgi:hypothetical protein